MKEFLNPKSMLTPGVAGGTMMFLVNGLAVPFPELPARYAALALSFVIGAVAFNAANLKVLERGVYWVLNSLVIFVVGFGAASIGHEASRGATAPVAERVAPAWLVASARAAEGPGAGKAGAAAAKKSAEASRATAAETEKLKLELEALRIENERLKKANENAGRPAQQEFFRKW